MKKFLLLSMMCLMALTIHAQKCAVLEFRGAQSISVADIDGISEMFMTYFRPAGYTMVERAQIDKVISEQGFQRSSITDDQAVRVGKILKVSKVVLGKVSRLGGQYQVDVRVVDVESGHDVALDGATFTGDYRANVRNLATSLAAKIAIKPGATVQPTPAKPAAPSTPKTRTNVEVLYGYLKIFPNELGVFQAEPSSVIAQINKQAMHGYNNWRIPTNEELALLRANGYLGNGEYMTKESKQGIVLLVSDGDDYETVQAKEQKAEEERLKAEQERKAAEEQKAEEERQARIKAAQERKAAEERAKQERERLAVLKAQGLVDLGLPSGTLWKDKNEDGGFYTYEEALSKFGDKLPTKEQLEELNSKCQWTWTGSGYKVTGPNGNSISLPAAGYRNCNGRVVNVGSDGHYWSSTPRGSDYAWRLGFGSGGVGMNLTDRCNGRSVRLVQD